MLILFYLHTYLIQIEEVVRVAVEEVQLTAEAGLGQEALSMSGGQRRRLCLAMALIADSRVVFLVRFLFDPSEMICIFSNLFLVQASYY